MRILFWYCSRIGWTPSMKTLEDSPPAEPAEYRDVVAAFIHVEPADTRNGGAAETKLVKNAKWLARKWGVRQVILHSFNHLGREKAEPQAARDLLDAAEKRLAVAGYSAVQTPYGYFNDLVIEAPGHPLARIYKEF